jgi:hypothetical protein
MASLFDLNQQKSATLALLDKATSVESLLADNNEQLEKIMIISTKMFDNTRQLNILMPELIKMGKTKDQLASLVKEIDAEITSTINGLKVVSPATTLSVGGAAPSGAAPEPRKLSAHSKPWPSPPLSFGEFTTMTTESMTRDISGERVEELNSAFGISLLPGTVSRQPSKVSWETWADVAKKETSLSEHK